MPEFVELAPDCNDPIYVNPNWVAYIRPLEKELTQVTLHDGKAWAVKGSAEAIRLLLSGRVR